MSSSGFTGGIFVKNKSRDEKYKLDMIAGAIEALEELLGSPPSEYPRLIKTKFMFKENYFQLIIIFFEPINKFDLQHIAPRAI